MSNRWGDRSRQKQTSVGALVVIFLLLLALGGLMYVTNEPSPTKFDVEQIQNNTIWIDITPPVGVEGPCAVSFITSGRRGFAFAVCD